MIPGAGAARRAVFFAGVVADAAWGLGARDPEPNADERASLSRLAEEEGVVDGGAVVLAEWGRFRSTQIRRAELVLSAIADAERALESLPPACAEAYRARVEARMRLDAGRDLATDGNWCAATEWVHEALANIDAALCAVAGDGGASARASAAWAEKLAARYDGDAAAARADTEWRAAVAAKNDAQRASLSRARIITDTIRSKLLPAVGFAD